MAEAKCTDDVTISSDTTGEQTISMLDVLEREAELEEDASAVLGDSDAHNCTYDMGYVNRQALYACLTCMPDAPSTSSSGTSTPSGDSHVTGVCLACSYDCHENHNLVELYTKRQFRCDCGNSKLSTSKCKLRPNKKAVNADNLYNQNYRGLYCTCSRPYPDPDNEDDDDEMIQCIICEDWFHGRHLGTVAPPSEDYEEMTCGTCIKKHPFLTAYITALHKDVHLDKTADSRDPVDVTGRTEPSCVTSENHAHTPARRTDGPPTSRDDDVVVKPTQDKMLKVNRPDGCLTSDVVGPPTEARNSAAASTDENVSSDKAAAVSDSSCTLVDLQTSTSSHTPEGAVFWPTNWRSRLCKCQQCKVLFDDNHIAFLLDEDDTISAYEKRGKEKQPIGTQFERGMQALSNIDRVQQVEAIHEFNDLKSELSAYLKKFSENGKVVREEDIKEFFTQLSSRKRSKQDGGVAMQYLCK